MLPITSNVKELLIDGKKVIVYKAKGIHVRGEVEVDLINLVENDYEGGYLLFNNQRYDFINLSENLEIKHGSIFVPKIVQEFI